MHKTLTMPLKVTIHCDKICPYKFLQVEGTFFAVRIFTENLQFENFFAFSGTHSHQKNKYI